MKLKFALAYTKKSLFSLHFLFSFFSLYE